MVRRKRSAPEAEPEGGAEAEREEEDEQKAPEAEENAPEAGESDEAEENAPKAEEADEAEPDEEDDDDDEFDFGAVADEAPTPSGALALGESCRGSSEGRGRAHGPESRRWGSRILPDSA